MIKLTFKLLAMNMMLMGINADAQFDKTKGYARIAGGVTTFKPSSTGKSKMSESWTGVNYRVANFEFGIMGGRISKNERPDSLISVYSTYFAYHRPILSKLAIGQRPFGIKGFLIQPTVTAFYGAVGSYKSEGSVFFGGAPGLSIQLPYIIIEARYNAMMNFSKDQLVTGLVHGPQINLQMDGLYDVFHPRFIKGGIQSITTTNYRPGLGDYYYESYGTGTIEGGAKVITPFIGITPGFTFAPHYFHKPAAVLAGIGATARVSFFSLDLFTRSGKMGFGTLTPADNGKPGDYKTKKWDQSSDKFSGSQKMRFNEARIGVDLVCLTLAVLYPGAMGTKELLYHPRYLRFYVGKGTGSYKIEDAPEFKHPEYTNDLYNNPVSVSNGDPNSSFYNPAKFADGKIASSFIAIELGSVGFSWDRRVFKNAGLMSGQTFSVYSSVPIGRVWKAYKGKLPKDEIDEY